MSGSGAVYAAPTLPGPWMRGTEMAKRTCLVTGCTRPSRSRGLCEMHYQRYQRFGDPGEPQVRSLRCLPVVDRFHAQYAIGPPPTHNPALGACWVWLHPEKLGYGRIMVEGKVIVAHRFSYELFIGPVPEGLELDHLCRVRSCVNPTHLEPVTPQTNMQRGTSPAAMNAAKTHCPHGHEYTPENTYRRPSKRGARECRTCKREGDRRYNTKRRST